MLKVGDRIINKKRTDDKLPNGLGKGVILKVESHYLIRWDYDCFDKSIKESWALKEVIELDVEETRDNKLNEILNEAKM